MMSLEATVRSRSVEGETTMSVPGLQATSKIIDEWRYGLLPPRRTGFVQVDQEPDHRLYWEEYGNPDGEPVFVLHGGPGGASSPNMSRYFDPERYRIILFDQRGCGRSTPTVAVDGAQVALTRNTTWDLVEDINKLRSALGIDGKMHLFGGSWGSTLALTYAIQFPESCANLVLRGIFLGGREDLDFLYQGNAATYTQAPDAYPEPGAYICYPEAWRRFLSVLNPSERANVMQSYKAIFDSVGPEDEQKRLEAAQAWSAWEGTISNLTPDPEDLGKYSDSYFALSFAQIEAHYFANDSFLEPDHIIRNVGKLTEVSVHIVHGRFDLVCPLPQAMRLKAALEEAGAAVATFVVTSAGHSGFERENALALTSIMDGLPRQI